MKNLSSEINQTHYNITFETKCYENDWEYLLKTNYLDVMIKRCNIIFDYKQLIINNVNNKDLVRKYAQRKVDKGVIDNFYFVDDFISDALKQFDIDKTSFGKGYYYSSAELVGIYLTKTKFLVHFSSDSIMPGTFKSKWISSACELLDSSTKYVVASACDYNYGNAIGQSTEPNIGDFIVGYGFSDQCYLVRTSDFKSNIYNFKHPDSERYPTYGGELFEKRVNSFMHVNELLKLTHSEECYRHRNFPKSESKLIKIITLSLIRINCYHLIRNLKIYLFRKFKLNQLKA